MSVVTASKEENMVLVSSRKEATAEADPASLTMAERKSSETSGTSSGKLKTGYSHTTSQKQEETRKPHLGNHFTRQRGTISSECCIHCSKSHH